MQEEGILFTEKLTALIQSLARKESVYPKIIYGQHRFV